MCSVACCVCKKEFTLEDKLTEEIYFIDGKAA
jgi:hypothetical protein